MGPRPYPLEWIKSSPNQHKAQFVGCVEAARDHVHGEQRKPQCGNSLTNVEVLQDARFAGHVDRTRNIEREVQETYLESDEQFPSARPVVRILFDV